VNKVAETQNQKLIDKPFLRILRYIQGLGDANYVSDACIRDNHWNSQKLSTEKSTVGNEPYIKKATVLGGFFVSIDTLELALTQKRISCQKNS